MATSQIEVMLVSVVSGALMADFSLEADATAEGIKRIVNEQTGVGPWQQHFFVDSKHVDDAGLTAHVNAAGPGQKVQLGLLVKAGLSTVAATIRVEHAGQDDANGDYQRTSSSAYRKGSDSIQYWDESTSWPAGWYFLVGRSSTYFAPMSVLDGFAKEDYDDKNIPLPLHGWGEAWIPDCRTPRPRVLPVPRVLEVAASVERDEEDI